MTRQPRTAKLRHQPDQFRVPIHRLNRAEPQPGAPSARRSPAPAPPASQSLRLGTGKSRPHRPRLIPESTSSLPPAATNPSTWRRTLRGQTPGRAARLRNHAKGAAVPAALLNFEVGPGLRAGHDLRLFKKRVGKPVVRPDHLRPLRWGQLLAHRSIDVCCSL
jgi:hypothetical protein